jgi:hypothetical protein
MNGWIKLEKDLLTDPRLYQLALNLCNGPALHGVTLALGAIARLWMIADTHIGDDDVLPIGTEGIDQVIGIQNFCQNLPRDWLQVIDSNHVLLPNFHVHNGTTAKARALTNKRVTLHRYRADATLKRSSVTKALPDQDQDLKRRKEKQTKEKCDVVTVEGLDQAAFDVWLAYRTEIKKPLRAASLLAVAKRLASMGPAQRTAVDYSIANGYQGLFAPSKTNGKHAPTAPDHSAEWAEAKALAASIGYRAPWPQESVGAYITSIKLELNQRPARSVAQLAKEAHERKSPQN